MQIAFFVTPVMWTRDQLPPTLSWVVDLNPFAALLAVIREPLLGAVPDRSTYVMSFGVTAIGLVVAIRFFARFRARIIYWL
jgi:ABC-type polysaccharide/polyol phosphate export permease